VIYSIHVTHLRAFAGFSLKGEVVRYLGTAIWAMFAFVSYLGLGRAMVPLSIYFVLRLRVLVGKVYRGESSRSVRTKII
jgi:hypothetical protein